MKHYDEYITTRAHIGANTNAFSSDFIKPLKPEGEGWEYLDSCCTDQFMYWNWGRVLTVTLLEAGVKYTLEE